MMSNLSHVKDSFVPAAATSSECDRPYCREPVTAYLPMPAGTQGDIAVCAQHEQEAQLACYFIVSIAHGAQDADFDMRTWAKHIALRGGKSLKYRPRGWNNRDDAHDL